MTVNDYFAELVGISRTSDLDANDCSALIAACIKPSRISLELRAGLRKRLNDIRKYGNPEVNELEILRKAFDLSNEFNKSIKHLKLEKINGSAVDIIDVPSHGNFGKIMEKIELEIDGEVILAQIMPSPRKAFADLPKQRAGEDIVFARELE